MPKSSRIELADLREAALARDGGCRWPECERWRLPLHMAHIKGKGMGGSREANTLENVVMLCEFHHDLFDQRSHYGLHRELAALLRTLI